MYALLERAVEYPLVVVYAGAGYGKTREIYSFTQEYDAAYTTWIQLTERDNVPARFWENHTHMISLGWPDVGANLRSIGFPESDEAFVRYLNQREKTFLSTKKGFMVFDDFHLLHNPVVLRFFERAVENLPPNIAVILISRSTPEINITGMMLNERIFTVSEDDLRFSPDEVAQYFRMLALPMTKWDLKEIYDDTQGWAFGLNLIGRSLKKKNKFGRYALKAMKENIFNLIEYELLQINNEALWRLLLRISLLDRFAASLVNTLAEDETVLKELHLLNAYIRYDHHSDVYVIHSIFLDYLRQGQHMLTDGEKQDTYNNAGFWYEGNNYIAEALTYYEKAGNYEAILRIIYSSELLLSSVLAKLAMEILDRAPKDVYTQHPLFPAMHIKTKTGCGLLSEASSLAQEYVLEYKGRPETPDNNRALGEIYAAWAVLRYIMSPFTDKYDFDAYFEKVREYSDKSPYQINGPAAGERLGVYAILVGTGRAGAPDEYIGALTRSSQHGLHVLGGGFYGLDDLARGELFFLQRNNNDAEQYLNIAADKARSKRQYDTLCRALQYLMLIAFSRGELSAADNYLAQIKAMGKIKGFKTRYESYDIASAQYYFALGQPEMIPDCFKGDFEKNAHPATLAGFANRMRAQYRYLAQQYDDALLAFLENERKNCTLLISKIVYLTLEALTLYHLKRKDEAIALLEEAYFRAAPNKIIVPFTLYSKDMRTLTSAALKSKKCKIPKPWLEDVNRKASAFAKRQKNLVSTRGAANASTGKIILTKRETLLLKDLTQGLSRTEIAASQNISVNTVKMVINSIYDKLLVNNVYDALHVAIAQKII